MSAGTAATFFMTGVTHRLTPLAVREQLALPPGAERELYDELAAVPGLGELAVLNTCNRVEFYGVADQPAAAAAVQAAFCRHRHFAEDRFIQYRQQHLGLPAVQHLFEVAAGIDSQLIGETEIFGQVKAAYEAAQSRHTTGRILNRVFQKSFQAAKHVRSHTAITNGKVSVANVAVDLAQSIFGRLADTRILLLGAGEIGEKAARAFQSRGAGALTVSSRHLQRAMELAQALNATALPFEHRENHLAGFDVVVCCTSAPGHVLTPAAITAAAGARATRPLFLIDLAVPRDIAPEAGRLPNVFLYNLDDLAAIAAENLAIRESEVAKCRHILAARAEALWRHLIPEMSAPAAGNRYAPIRERPAV